ncbi:MAG: flagellar hook-associated protein FlgK, partial [Deltaproteobacteria bacterium]
GTRYNFFDPSGTLSSGTLEVNPVLVSDVGKIAAGDTSDPGDNQTAIRIAGLQNTLAMSGGTTTFDEYYNAVVSDVGIAVKDAASNYDHQESMAAYMENYRESVSGVSLDEEMVSLIKFQHAYNAAAKLITTVDELLDTLIRSV